MRASRLLPAAALALAAVVSPVVSPALAPVTDADAAPFTPAGTRVTGGDSAGAATALGPGVWLDRLPRGASDSGEDGSVRWYGVSVGAGERLAVAATIAAPQEPRQSDTLAVGVDVHPVGSTTSCAQDSATSYESGGALAPPTAVAVGAPAGEEGACPAGPLVVRVARTGDAAVDEPLGVEVAVRVEPRASGAGLPGPAPSVSNIPPALTGRPAALASGSGFEDAPLVGTGIYGDRIAGGDTRVVRVHLGWGQQVAVAVTAAERPGVEYADGLQVHATLLNPLRQELDPARGSTDTAYSVGADDATVTLSSLVPVRWANRRADDRAVTRYAVAGDYFLVLGADRPDSGRAVAYPYTVQVRVSGAVAGVPSYATPSGTSAAALPPVTTPGGTSTAVAVAVGAGVVLVLAVLAGLVLLRRGRQARTHT